MNHSEFLIWKARYNAAFPSVGKWLGKLGDELKAAQLDKWEGLLRGVSLADATQVIARMTEGVIDRVGPFDSDQEDTGLIVRNAARDIERDRAEAAYEREAIQCDGAPIPMSGGCSTVGLYRRILDLRESGADDATIKAVLAEEVGGHPGDGVPSRRVRCELCEDSGFVQVWAPSTIARIKAKAPVERKHRRTVTTACSCEFGDKRCRTDGATPNAGRGAPRPKLIPDGVRYDPRRYCLVRGGDTGDDAFRELESWCAAFFESLADERVKQLEAADRGLF